MRCVCVRVCTSVCVHVDLCAWVCGVRGQCQCLLLLSILFLEIACLTEHGATHWLENTREPLLCSSDWGFIRRWRPEFKPSPSCSKHFADRAIFPGPSGRCSTEPFDQVNRGLWRLTDAVTMVATGAGRAWLESTTFSPRDPRLKGYSFLMCCMKMTFLRRMPCATEQFTLKGKC